MTTLMLSIFETVNTKRDQATTKPASKQAKATTSDPVTNTDLFFDNCVTLNFWVGELDLETDLLEIVDDKKEDAVAERTAVMGSGWLEAQYELLT